MTLAASERQRALQVGPLQLPSGRSLPRETWQRRHRGILVLLALQTVGLLAFGLFMGVPASHALLEAGVIAALTLAAAVPAFDSRFRSVLSAIGLMSTSAVLVHLSGGYIEAHFHFFVMLGIIFLYEDWFPYVLAVAYVALHHGIAGTLDPLSVYNHASAIASPWKWAGIHAIFILGLSTALLLAWNVIERARQAESRATHEAVELKRQLHSQEKMAALGSLVSGLAHEVRTPLTIATTNASLLEILAHKDPGNALSARVLKHAGEIKASADRINALVLQLRKFHSLGPEDLQVAPLDPVVKEALHLFTSATKAIRHIEVDLQPTPPAKLHVLGVHQIVLNLLSNAVDATDSSRGILRIRTHVQGGHAVLVVADNGIGMTEETQRQAFDPLFTTKQDGMGLGLHIVKRIVDAHGGDIWVRSEVGVGTRVEVRFPLAPVAREVPVDAGDATQRSATAAR